MNPEFLKYNHKDKDSHIKFLLYKRFNIEFDKNNFEEAELIFNNFCWLYPDDGGLCRGFLSRYTERIDLEKFLASTYAKRGAERIFFALKAVEKHPSFYRVVRAHMDYFINSAIKVTTAKRLVDSVKKKKNGTIESSCRQKGNLSNRENKEKDKE